MITQARNWKVFDRKHALSEGKAPQLSIQRGGTLGINHRLYEALGRPERIVFVWDPDSRAFGLSTHIQGKRSTYPVRPQESKTSWVINATSFLRWAGIPYGDHVRYYTPIVENGIAVIELGSPSPAPAESGSALRAEGAAETAAPVQTAAAGITEQHQQALALWRAQIPPSEIVAALYSYTPTKGPHRGQAIPVTPEAPIYPQRLEEVMRLIQMAEAATVR